jgi:RHS repeat-associated protein
VILPGTGGTVNFKYDPFGRRTQKAFTHNGTTTTTDYVYDHSDVLETINQSGTVLSRYTDTLNVDEPLSELISGTTSYYEQDGLGSVSSLSNSAGALANTYAYDSYGKLLASTGTLANPFQYTGREFDSETGVYGYRARYYDPSIGRFLSEDPMRFSVDENFYRYVYNSPVGLSDPSGLDGGDAPGDPGTTGCPGGYCGPAQTAGPGYTLKPGKPGVPAPSPALDKFLRCLGGCIGAPIVVTATTPLPGEQHQDPGHAGGTSVDIRPPAGIPAGIVFCCAGKCGAARGLNEGPGGQRTLYTTAPNYHFQLVPSHHPGRNDIPPGCGGGCAAAQ